MSVVVVGMEPFPWADTGAAALLAPVPVGVPAVLGALRAALDADGWALAVHPSWRHLDPGADLAVARRALDTPRVVPLPTSLPPLAAAVLAGLALRLADEDPGLGLLVAAVRSAESALGVHAWARSVAGLSAPAPSLAQHARSLAPGARFHVEVQPVAHVASLGKEPERALTRPESARVTVAGPDEEWRWAEPFVVDKLGEPTRRREPTPDATAWWGTAKLVEAVVAPSDPLTALSAVRASGRGRPCRWCAEPVWADPCPVCGFSSTDPRSAAGAA